VLLRSRASRPQSAWAAEGWAPPSRERPSGRGGTRKVRSAPHHTGLLEAGTRIDIWTETPSLKRTYGSEVPFWPSLSPSAGARPSFQPFKPGRLFSSFRETFFGFKRYVGGVKAKFKGAEAIGSPEGDAVPSGRSREEV